MRVLSVRQPWASAIIYLGKDVENRSWPTSHRGLLAIHASKTMVEMSADLASYGVSMPSRDDMPFGAIIGTVEVVDCVPIERLTSPSRWADGPLIERLTSPSRWADPKPLPTPIFVGGKLGLWDYDVK